MGCARELSHFKYGTDKRVGLENFCPASSVLVNRKLII